MKYAKNTMILCAIIVLGYVVRCGLGDMKQHVVHEGLYPELQRHCVTWKDLRRDYAFKYAFQSIEPDELAECFNYEVK